MSALGESMLPGGRPGYALHRCRLRVVQWDEASELALHASRARNFLVGQVPTRDPAKLGDGRPDGTPVGQRGRVAGPTVDGDKPILVDEQGRTRKQLASAAADEQPHVGVHLADDLSRTKRSGFHTDAFDEELHASDGVALHVQRERGGMGLAREYEDEALVNGEGIHVHRLSKTAPVFRF